MNQAQYEAVEDLTPAQRDELFGCSVDIAEDLDLARAELQIAISDWNTYGDDEARRYMMSCHAAVRSLAGRLSA